MCPSLKWKKHKNKTHRTGTYLLALVVHGFLSNYMEEEEPSSRNVYLRCIMDTFGPKSMITSGQIASTENYAFDI